MCCFFLSFSLCCCCCCCRRRRCFEFFGDLEGQTQLLKISFLHRSSKRLGHLDCQGRLGFIDGLVPCPLLFFGLGNYGSDIQEMVLLLRALKVSP